MHLMCIHHFCILLSPSQPWIKSHYSTAHNNNDRAREREGKICHLTNTIILSFRRVHGSRAILCMFDGWLLAAMWPFFSVPNANYSCTRANFSFFFLICSQFARTNEIRDYLRRTEMEAYQAIGASEGDRMKIEKKMFFIKCPDVVIVSLPFLAFVLSNTEWTVQTTGPNKHRRKNQRSHSTNPSISYSSFLIRVQMAKRIYTLYIYSYSLLAFYMNNLEMCTNNILFTFAWKCIKTSFCIIK